MNAELQGAALWNARYSAEGFAFGDQPEFFLRSQEALLRAHAAVAGGGKALCLAEGEGRNAVWLAGLGYSVTAMDMSSSGLEKAHRLAERHGVEVETVVADLAEFEPGWADWDLIVSIWCHLPPLLRARVHGSVVRALKPGGLLVLTAYTPGQIARGTGGPSTPDKCMPLEKLREEFSGLDFIVGREVIREVYEGAYHTGLSEVVEVVGRLPEG